MKRNVHLSYLRCERGWTGVCKTRVSNRDFREIRWDRGDNQMNNCRWFFDVERDCNRIQNVVNEGKEQEEIFEI